MKNINPSQPVLQFGVPEKPSVSPFYQFRLRAGDWVLYEDKICPVIRVSECCAVLAMAKPAREFTTIFGKTVCIKPKPGFVRISSNSEIPIVRRQKGGA